MDLENVSYTTETDDANEIIYRKLREHFYGKIVRKDLTKEGANVPVYVLEFLLRECGSRKARTMAAWCGEGGKVRGLPTFDKMDVERFSGRKAVPRIECFRKYHVSPGRTHRNTLPTAASQGFFSQKRLTKEQYIK
ncbi:Conserved hypothetical protein CHP02688 [Acididesulfobacillus acetoxydans]|uniref:ATP-dependent Lon protease n=1 Tax=Acididesulfobacillus acetoxydans TaxID=1561005 RepID=A0A8S0Y4Y5_9FIRM|nr:anti-phage BREX system Lon protease BrxL [Acididesulfobacillus acetoxydans]CAA7603435.1 Conserved hypothetical protein CHP02688 [Acididesulfobacillus acetoxydans]CEJ07150.1 Putative ATP-dependent Lon protease [Acididesulfobacillus acetoxydans]